MRSSALMLALLLAAYGCLDPVAGPADASRDAAGRRDVGEDAADATVDADPDPRDAGFDGDPPMCWVTYPDSVGGIPALEFEGQDLALRGIVLDQATSWSSIGWDLDRRCTEPGDDHLCSPPDAPEPPTDGDGGSDNAFGRYILPLIVEAYPTLESEVRDRMSTTEPLLIGLDEFNFTLEDNELEVTLLSAVGVSRADALPAPQWDGEDMWDQSSGEVNGVGAPRKVDQSAHVTDGVLVAKIPIRQPIVLPWVGGRRVELRLLGGVLTGRLTDFNGEYFEGIEDVILQGRMLPVDVESFLDDAGICEGDPLRNRVLEEMRRRLDSEGDRPDPICNAISIALAFEGGPRVLRGPPRDPGMAPECPM